MVPENLWQRIIVVRRASRLIDSWHKTGAEWVNVWSVAAGIAAYDRNHSLNANAWMILMSRRRFNLKLGTFTMVKVEHCSWTGELQAVFSLASKHDSECIKLQLITTGIETLSERISIGYHMCRLVACWIRWMQWNCSCFIIRILVRLCAKDHSSNMLMWVSAVYHYPECNCTFQQLHVVYKGWVGSRLTALYMSPSAIFIQSCFMTFCVLLTWLHFGSAVKLSNLFIFEPGGDWSGSATVQLMT